MSKHWFHEYLLQYYSKKMKNGLDIGCGQRNYHEDIKCDYIGIDLPTYYENKTKADIFADGTYLPFKDNSFDLILSLSVLPLVKNVDLFLDEIHRVLKNNGVAVIIIMNIKGLSLNPKKFFYNRYNNKELRDKLSERNFSSIIERNIKAWVWSTWFNKTSVYAYAVVTPKKS